MTYEWKDTGYGPAVKYATLRAAELAAEDYYRGEPWRIAQRGHGWIIQTRRIVHED